MRTFATAAAVVAAGSLVLPATVGSAEVESASSAEVLVPPSSVADAEFRVGAPEVVANGHSKLDSKFNFVKVDGVYRGYMGNHETMRYEGISMEKLFLKGEFALKPSAPENKRFDECGAMISGVVVDADEPSVLRAWYHAEQKDGLACDYSTAGEGQTHKSIAHAKSVDGGITFTKPGWYDNQVITRHADPLENGEPGIDGEVSGRGDFGLIRSDDFDGNDYYYIYYLDHVVVNGKVKEYAAVARALVSSDGGHTAWRNLHNGDWTELALDGESDDLSGPVMANPSVYLPGPEVVRVRQRPKPEEPALDGGVLMSFSSDPRFLTSGVTEPLVYMNQCDSFEAPEVLETPKVDPCDPNPHDLYDPGNTMGQRLLYTSIVGPSGSTDWDDSFYLFYVYGVPGENTGDPFKTRYLVRRKVTVTSRQSGGPQTKLALATYESHHANPGDRWTTASVAPVTHAYLETTGYIMTAGAGDPARSLLTDCFKAATGDHYLSSAGCDSASEHRLDLGYVWKSQAPGTVRLRLCQYPNGGDRFATTVPDCVGASTLVSTLGYVYPVAGDEKIAADRVDKATDMFSGQQGLQRWSYLNGPGVEFDYDKGTNSWGDPGSAAQIWSGSMSPGVKHTAQGDVGVPSVRRWTADTAAHLTIASSLSDFNSSCSHPSGNGVQVKILHRSKADDFAAVVLYSRHLANGFAPLETPSVDVVVAEGDRIDFQLEPVRADVSCDRTVWKPSITVVP